MQVFDNMVNTILNLDSKVQHQPVSTITKYDGIVTKTPTGLIHQRGVSVRNKAENQRLYGDVDVAWDKAQTDFENGVSLEQGLLGITEDTVRAAYKSSYNRAQQWANNHSCTNSVK